MKRLFCLIIIALLFSGCAFTRDYATIEYLPMTGVSEVNGADAVRVSVRISDARTVRDKNKISHKKNGYGINCASIMSNNDVLKLISGAIETELNNRGFKIAAGDVGVDVEVSKFYNNWKMGFWSGSAVSEVTINVQVKEPDHILYTKTIMGEHTRTGVQMTSGKNAKLALEEALKDAIAKLMNDSAFISALIKAGE